MGKTIVVGLGRSGLGAANLLASNGRDVTVTDIRAEEKLGKYIEGLDPSVDLALGGHPESLFEDAELIVVSPGVPLGMESLRKAKEAGIGIIGELELAYQRLKGLPFYAVTGTNGKSTTVTLLDLMLRKAGRKTLLGGNIGNALTGEIVKGVEGIECVAAEVSSFQLETIEKFRPKVAAVLNITPDHLDRYPSMADYRQAKARIALNQQEDDFLVLNTDDPGTMKMLNELEKGFSAPRIVMFSRKMEVSGVCLKGDTVFFNMETSVPLIRADEIAIKGVHNLENAMAASAVALLAGAHPEAVAEALREFGGLEHRLEFVREIEGVRYINDSKGTNVGAVVKSLEGFREPVVLIAGGRDKNGDFDTLRKAAEGRLRALVLIGEAREKLSGALGDIAECVLAEDMEDAVSKAAGMSRGGDVVLLSPACASFDMFRDFEERGREFKRVVMKL
jgi:UDP-N-acetylmuramoylalanine--D-glutamate ligase